MDLCYFNHDKPYQQFKNKCTKNIVSLTLLDAPILRERATLTSQSIGAKWTTRVQAFARCVLERVERPQGVKFNPFITHGGPYKPQCSHIYTLIISIYLSIYHYGSLNGTLVQVIAPS